ncbi:apoptosis regulatory protein Siva-like [Saccostrea cucullata]|uniref:apoptosis regulatory protein Siva-like n=1 Tax=Saccostrea cuccullata TaxID=36930 RepID=UPI002ED558CF
MPKRRNPFGEGSPLQLKSHIGNKELNAGVSGEQNLKAVYERTKNMLFNGVQTLYHSDTVTADANCNLPFITNYNTMDATSQVPGQLVIDHEGQLTVPSALNRAQNEDMETSQPTAFGLNNSSGTFDFSKGKKPVERRRLPSDERCNFCEKALSNEQSLQCCNCQRNFCQLCSVLNYDESFERVFCLGCSA